MPAPRRAAIAVLTALLLSRVAVSAEIGPFVPADERIVLERLPLSPLDPAARRLRALREQLAGEPDNLALATQVAWQSIEQGRRLADPRFYGYAQGALGPWWSAVDAPVAVLVLRATIRQHDHDFASALDDLDRAVRADPDNTQAWLTRAVVLQVRGEYAAARRSCLAVLPRARPLVTVTCLSGVDSLSGAAAPAYERLRRALAQATDVELAARRWALTTLAEIAARTGHAGQAEAHFRQALGLGGGDDYLLGAYADLLLDQRRAAEVRALLADKPLTDAVLLRRVLADVLLMAPELERDAQLLRDRFTAARLRGDTVHRREEARFALHVLGDAPAALALARANWTVQREPWDARILLESALATGEREAAQPVLAFLDRSGLEDAALAAAAARLGETAR